MVTTDSNGNVSFSVSLPVVYRSYATATASIRTPFTVPQFPYCDTSELAQCILILSGGAGPASTLLTNGPQSVPFPNVEGLDGPAGYSALGRADPAGTLATLQAARAAVLGVIPRSRQAAVQTAGGNGITATSGLASSVRAPDPADRLLGENNRRVDEAFLKLWEDDSELLDVLFGGFPQKAL